jgi:hypothetical protein
MGSISIIYFEENLIYKSAIQNLNFKIKIIFTLNFFHFPQKRKIFFLTARKNRPIMEKIFHI